MTTMPSIIDEVWEQNPDALLFVTPDGLVLQCNPAAEAMFGYSRDEAVGRPVTSLITPQDRADEGRRFVDDVAREGSAVFESVGCRKDGSLLHVNVSVKSVHDRNGKFRYSLSNIKDVTRLKVSRDVQLVEAAFRNLLESTPDAIAVANVIGRIVLVNSQVERLFGYSPGELLGQPVEVLLPSRFRSAHLRHRSGFTESPHSRNMSSGLELYGVRKNGEEFPVEISLSPLKIEEGTMVMSAIRDVSDRKKADQKFKDLLESAPDAMVIVNDAGDIVLVNTQTVKLFGWSREELLSKKIEALMPERFRQHHPAHRSGFSGKPRARAMGEDVELSALRKDGTEFPVEISLSPLATEAGNLVMSAIRDITQRRQIIEQLRESERRFSELLHNVHLVALMLDLDGRITYCNDYLLRLTDWRHEELIGRSVFEILVPHVDNLEAVFKALLENRPEAWHRENEIITRSGEYRLIRWNNSVLRSGSGVVIGSASIGEDITEQKRAETEIRTLNATLEQRVIDRTADLELARNDASLANQAKSSFLATMSHEIRTPMNGIIGMVDVLHQSSLRGDQVEMVDLIRESAHSLLTIIDDILDFSKIEAGRLQLDCAPLRVGDVIEDACGMMLYLAEKSQVALDLFVDPEIPGPLTGDALRLRQVLINLVGNAIKFSRKADASGQVSVRALLVERSAKRIVVDIGVLDNGIGMDEATQAKLFSPFSQGDASTTRRFGGTGLGLVIARSLTDLMGGELTLTSTADCGASFNLKIPFEFASAESNDKELPDIQGLCCVVIGSPTEMTQALTAYLKFGGASVVRANDLAVARKLTENSLQTLCIWIIDAPLDTPSPESLRMATASGDAQADIRFVVIRRGNGRGVLDNRADFVTVNGNGLTRRALHKAVSIAAGRKLADERSSILGNEVPSPIAPSRATALREGRLILVAEDNETNRQVVQHQLGLLGYVADIAVDGAQALQYWQQRQYGLLLTDVHMPEMDGYELTSRIRAEENGVRHIPIVALTANALKDAAERCLAVGMDDFLSKPVRLPDLKSALEKWLPAPATTTGGSTIQSLIPQLAASAAAVNLHDLIDQVGSDRHFIRQYLGDFRIASANMAARLRHACEAGDAATAQAIAHKIKSSARSIGAQSFGEVCESIETACRVGDGSALVALRRRFDAELAAVDDLLAKELATNE